MGWRLPPTGEHEFGVRSFAAGLVSSPRGDDHTTRYASPNTDMLGWIIERATGERYADLASRIWSTPDDVRATGRVQGSGP